MIKEMNISRDVEKLAWSITSILKENYMSRSGIIRDEAGSRAGYIRDRLSNRDIIILVGYVLYRVKENNKKSVSSIVRFDDVRIREAVENANIDSYTWEQLLELVDRFTLETFKELVLTFEFDPLVGTPDSVSRLALRILNPQEKEELVDLDCGYGEFLVASKKYANPKAFCRGYEMNTTVSQVATARGILSNFAVGNTDKYTLIEAGMKNSFDKGFAAPRWGQRAGSMPFRAANFIRSLDNIDVNQFIFPSTSGEWVEASLMMQLLKEKGKAVIMTTMGALTNGIDTQARRHFVDNQYIEAVIALPEKIFAPYTSIPCAMVVLSRFNQEMRLIDATDIFTKGRRRNELSDADIAEIMERYHNAGPHSIKVSTFMRGNYPLNPKRYLTKNIVIENGVRFGDITLDIKRGAQLSAKKLDEVISTEETTVQYLKVNNIQDGVICGEIPYVKEDKSLERYFINDNDIIMSKVAASGKVALASIESGKHLVLGANLFAITVDTKKADPVYIKLFLESDQGAKLVESIASGVTVPMISVEELKDMVIPLPSLDKQEAIVKAYREAEADVARLKAEYEAAYKKLKNIINMDRS